MHVASGEISISFSSSKLSIATIAVMIFVVDAMGNRTKAFF